MEDITHLEEKYNKEVKGLVQKTRDLLRSKYGLWFLGAFAFADSALGLPVTMDPFLVAYMVANRKKAWWGCGAVVAGSVLGGIVAYVLADFFTNQLLSILSPHVTQGFNHMVREANRGALVYSFIGALTAPYTLVAVVAGVLKINFYVFIIGSIVGRTLRYGIVAYFVYFYGERALAMAKKNILRVSLAVIVLVALLIFFKLYR